MAAFRRREPAPDKGPGLYDSSPGSNTFKGG